MAQTRPKTKYSVRLVFIGIFFAFIAVTVGMLNVYPTTTARDVVFSAKQSALLSRAGVMSSSLSALEKLSPEGVTQVMGLVGAEDYERAVVTDQDGMVLYDTDPMGGILGTALGAGLAGLLPIAEIQYLDENGNPICAIRKAFVQRNISGCGDCYSIHDRVEADGIGSVNLLGNNSGYQVAYWTHGGYSYSVTTVEILSEDAMLELVSQVG